MRPTHRQILASLAAHPDTWVIPNRIPDVKGNTGNVSGIALRSLMDAGLIEYGRDPKHSLSGYRLTALGMETELALRHRLEKCDRISRRIIDEADRVVALALLLGNGQWCLSDINGTRIAKAAFASPKEVLACFVGRQIDEGMKRREAAFAETAPSGP